MKPVSYDVVDMKGKKAGSMDLDPEVFGTPVYKGLVHQTVRWQRAKKRAGTHSTLTRGDMQGGGKKPWKQKGTGRARAGTLTSPVWVGGGVAHGPKPRSYEFRLNKRERRRAMTSVLSDKVKLENLVIIDGLAIESGKTRDMVAVLNAVGLAGKKLTLLLPEKNESLENVWRSANNIDRLKLVSVSGANVYDLLDNEVLVSTKEGIEKIQQRVKNDTAAA